MGKEEGLIKMGEWEKKGWLKKHRSQHVFDDSTRGHAFACYCEEQLQLLAAQHEWEVLGVRRCLHTVPGKGFARTGPGAFGWLRVMPACFEQTELEFKFKMGVKAPVGWEKGVYQGTSGPIWDNQGSSRARCRALDLRLCLTDILIIETSHRMQHLVSHQPGLISRPMPPRTPLSSTFSVSRKANICMASVSEQAPGKTIVVKNQSGDLPFPWSEKDPYKLPVSIDRVQRLLISSGWEKPWVEQIIDRVMKGMLRTTEERCTAVLDYLTSVGLKQDEICNMASISVVLLGLNPETRLKPIVAYLKSRGVPDASIPDLLLKHPRIVEYTSVEGQPFVTKLKARIQVDVVPPPPGSSDGTLSAAAVNYYREGAAFLVSPVSPSGPLDAAAIAALSAASS